MLVASHSDSDELCLTLTILQESRAVAGNPRDAAVIFDP